MIYLTMILGAAAFGLGIGLMSKQEPEKKPWKRKKNFFVRMGEGDVTYPGYTVHND